MTISLKEWKQKARSLKHRGHQVAWFSDGAPSSPALLLLHGFPTSSWDYHLQWEGLARSYRMVTFDMMGYGLSDKPSDYSYSCNDQADIAEEVCEELGISDCFVVAQDVGDSVCQELLARQIDGGSRLVFRKVFLMNGGLFPERHRATDFQKALLGPGAEALPALVTEEAFANGLKPLFGPSTFPNPVALKELWELTSRADGIQRWPQIIQYMNERQENRERWVGALVKCPVPLRLLTGAKDPVSGRHMAEYYQEVVPNPDVRILDDIGHFPQMEAPEIVLQEVLEFFG